MFAETYETYWDCEINCRMVGGLREMHFQQYESLYCISVTVNSQ